MDHEPLAPDETPASPTGDLAPSEDTPEAPEPDKQEDQPEPTVCPPADEPAPPVPTAPDSSGPVATDRAPSDPEPATLTLPLVDLDTPADAKKKHDPVRTIFDAYVAEWRVKTKGRRAPKLDTKRRKLTQARLREFCEDDLIAAARGIFASEWHMENNQTSYDLVMRDAAHVECFMKAHDAAQPGPPPDPQWLAAIYGRPSARLLRFMREHPPDTGSMAGPLDFNKLVEDVGSIGEVVSG